jgi:hypothetical protein
MLETIECNAVYDNITTRRIAVKGCISLNWRPPFFYIIQSNAPDLSFQGNEFLMGLSPGFERLCGANYKH